MCMGDTFGSGSWEGVSSCNHCWISEVSVDIFVLCHVFLYLFASFRAAIIYLHILKPFFFLKHAGCTIDSTYPAAYYAAVDGNIHKSSFRPMVDDVIKKDFDFSPTFSVSDHTWEFGCCCCFLVAYTYTIFNRPLTFEPLTCKPFPLHSDTGKFLKLLISLVRLFFREVA